MTDWPLYLLKPRSFEPRDLDSLIAPFAFTGSSIVDFFLDEVALSSEPAAQSAYGPWRSAKAPPALNVSRLRFRLPSDTQGHEHYDPNNVDSFVIRKDIYGYFGCLMAFRVAEALGLTNWQHMAARGLVRCLPAACLHPHTRPHWEGLASTTCQALSLLPMCSSVHVDHDIVRDMVANGTPYAGARSPDPLVAYLRVRCAPDQASLNVGSGAYSGGFRLTADSFALDRLEEIDSNSLRT